MCVFQHVNCLQVFPSCQSVGGDAILELFYFSPGSWGAKRLLKVSGHTLPAPKVSGGCATGWSGAGWGGRRDPVWEMAGSVSCPGTGGGTSREAGSAWSGRGLGGRVCPGHRRSGRLSGWRKIRAELGFCRVVRRPARGALRPRFRLPVATWLGPGTGVCLTGVGGACCVSEQEPGGRREGQHESRQGQGLFPRSQSKVSKTSTLMTVVIFF